MPKPEIGSKYEITLDECVREYIKGDYRKANIIGRPCYSCLVRILEKPIEIVFEEGKSKSTHLFHKRCLEYLKEELYGSEIN